MIKSDLTIRPCTILTFGNQKLLSTNTVCDYLKFRTDLNFFLLFFFAFSLTKTNLEAMVNCNDVKIAVIGGSGLYNLEGLEVIEEVNPETVSV